MISKNSYLYINLFIFFILTIIFGLFISINYGVIIGLGIFLFTLLILMKFGDKIVLILLKARYITDDDEFVNHVKNLSFHLKISKVKVYTTSHFSNNIYYTDASYGSPSIIIGKSVKEKLTKNELVSLINASLIRIKQKDAKNRTLGSLIVVISYLPFFYLYSLARGTVFETLFGAVLYPSYVIKGIFYDKPELIFDFDLKVSSLKGLSREYMSALYKVSKLPMINEQDMSAFVVNELTHINNKYEEVIFSTVLENVSVYERVENLKNNI